MPVSLPVPSAEDRRDKESWRVYFENALGAQERQRRAGRFYRSRVAELVRSIVPEGARVLEIGCGEGDLLAALRPSLGVGIDFSHRVLERAKARHPELKFVLQDAENLRAEKLGGPFDYVVLSDLVGSLVDVWRCFRSLHRVCTPGTRVVLTYYNYLWEPILSLAERLGLKRRQPKQNWLPLQDLENLLSLASFEMVRRGTATLLPVYVPLVSWLLNRYVAPLPIFYHLCLSMYLVVRPQRMLPPRSYSVAVVVPCQNEADNIDPLVERVPKMGAWTEILFVDGNSTDGTVERIKHAIEREKGRRPIRLIPQGEGRGKSDAVHKGIAQARGEILMVLDADLTMLPEDLPKFYLALAEGRAEFVNGTRFVYPMDERAMRPLNLLGNKFFSVLFSWLLGQRVRDTLCGTKVFFRRHYDRILSIRECIGTVDPFGDFELLFGASYGNLKIVEMPVRYRERTYGETKISRFRDGWRLLKLCLIVLSRLKWIG